MIKNNKILIVSLVVLIVSMGVVSFAKVDSNISENINSDYRYDRFKENMEFKKKLVIEDYNNKKITKEEKDLWISHFDSMIDNYKNEDGYGYGYGYGHGHCHNNFQADRFNNTIRTNRHNGRMHNNMHYNNRYY